jgi:hypothetical protein
MRSNLPLANSSDYFLIRPWLHGRRSSCANSTHLQRPSAALDVEKGHAATQFMLTVYVGAILPTAAPSFPFCLRARARPLCRCTLKNLPDSRVLLSKLRPIRSRKWPKRPTFLQANLSLPWRITRTLLLRES